MIPWLLACAAPPEDDGAPAPVDVACDDVDDTQVVVVRSMLFARREDGVSAGFDLDDHVTDSNDEEGCYQPDLVSPAGVEGIDNAFSAFFPVLEATEGAAVEGLLQEAIDSGEVLLLFELEDVDDPLNDDCVNLTLVQGIGTPRLGTDGVILSGQTFDPDPDIAPIRIEGLSIVDGTVEARGIELTFPIQIFDLELEFTMQNAAVSLTLDELGGAAGHLGGGLDIAYFIALLEERQDIEIGDLAIELIRTYADLYPDETGTCPQLSAVLGFEATSAFLFEDGGEAGGEDTSSPAE